MDNNNIFQHTVHVHALYGVTKVEKWIVGFGQAALSCQ